MKLSELSEDYIAEMQPKLGLLVLFYYKIDNFKTRDFFMEIFIHRVYSIVMLIR